MLIDFTVGVLASIVASIVCGFFSHKAMGKNGDVLSSIYTIYIGFSAFVFVMLLAFLLSDNLQNALTTWSGTSLFNLIKYVTSLFWILFINVSIVTIIFIITRQIELNSKMMDQEHKSYMKMLRDSEMSGPKDEI